MREVGDPLHSKARLVWLNIHGRDRALSVLAGQCLDQRIPDREALAREVGAWEEERNADESTIDWRFTTADARIKLKHLYPLRSWRSHHMPQTFRDETLGSLG